MIFFSLDYSLITPEFPLKSEKLCQQKSFTNFSENVKAGETSDDEEDVEQWQRS